MEKVKKIHFEVDYFYPIEMDNDKILDKFAKQIINDASEVKLKDIEIVDIK